MLKIPDCDRCQYFANSPYMVCGVNPCGPRGTTCEDFAAIAEDLESEAPQPLGGGYYLGDWLPQPFPTLTTAEQLSLLDEPPPFNSRCPNCEMPIAAAVQAPRTCGRCQWEASEAIAAS